MSKTLKLVILAALLVIPSAFASKQTKFVFRYPQYLYAYTNLDVEIFYFDKSGPGSNPGTYTTKYGAATEKNLATCMENLKPPSVTAQTAAGSKLIGTGKCDFVATDTEKNTDFTVGWGSTGEKPDGALLILTNAGKWTAAAYLSKEFKKVAKMVTLQVRVDKNKLDELSASNKTKIGSMAGSTLTNAYNTDYVNAYVVPLQFVMVLNNPFSIPVINGQDDEAVVTYDVAAP